jgi:hypothetical protein
MKKKIYYTVEKEVACDGETLTGNKDVSVYSIFNDVPKCIFTLDLTNDQNSKSEILDYLNDNGNGDDEFEIVLL